MGDVNDVMAVEFRGVRVAFGERLALNDLDLAVAAGSSWGLLGPNGSGKSTLIGCIAGLQRISAGSAQVFGAAPGPATRRQTGFVFQDSGLDPLMTCRETLMLQARMFGMSRRPAVEVSGDALSRAGLADRADAPVGTLSGGMRRRLAVARGILSAPRLLVLDEPTVGLDPDARRDLWDYLAELHRGGMTLIVASQDVTEVERGCDSVVFLREGRVTLAGKIEDLRRGLRHDAVIAELARPDPVLAAKVAAWPGVGVARLTNLTLHATVDDASTFVPKLFQAATGEVKGLRIRESTLEDAYFTLTGTAASEAGE